MTTPCGGCGGGCARLVDENGVPYETENGVTTVPRGVEVKALENSPFNVVPQYDVNGVLVCYQIEWAGTVTPDRTQLLAADGTTVLIDFTPYL